MRLGELQERLLAWATAEERKEELLAARKAHFEAHGEPHEEDRTYESRVNAMLDFYVYDFRAAGGTGTMLERFLESDGAAMSAEDLAAYRALAKTIHGLFEVRKISDGKVRLRDATTGSDYDVTERRTTAGLEKGDLLEARLLPFDGTLLFSGAFLYHPREARKPILSELKRLKKAAGKGNLPDVSAFLARLARMAMKLERYRNVRLESIYDFSPEQPHAATPRPPAKTG